MGSDQELAGSPLIRADRAPFLLCFRHGVGRAARGGRVGVHARRVRRHCRPRRSGRRRRGVRLEQQRFPAGYRQWIVVVGEQRERFGERRCVELRHARRCSARRCAVSTPEARRQLHPALAVLQHQVQRRAQVREPVHGLGSVLRPVLHERMLRWPLVQRSVRCVSARRTTGGDRSDRWLAALSLLLLTRPPEWSRPELPMTLVFTSLNVCTIE